MAWMSSVLASLLDRVELVGKVLVEGEERCCTTLRRRQVEFDHSAVSSPSSSLPLLLPSYHRLLPGVCERSVLPLRPHRPHRRFVFFRQTSLVEHQQRSESGSGDGDLRQISPGTRDGCSGMDSAGAARTLSSHFVSSGSSGRKGT